MERLFRACLRSWSVWMQNLHGIAVLLNPFGRRVLPKSARKPRTVRTYTRDTLWGSQDGKYRKIRDLEDTHLANIITYLITNFGEEDPILAVMIQEAYIRGLTREFLVRAYIPFKDKDGNWMLWDQDKFRSVKVG